jgi:MarR family transcriptional regulator, organic hydroperoxide resistance regulator
MGAVDEMVCFSLYAATRATTQAYRSLLAPWNLTYPQYLVLVLLWDCDGRAVRDLGEHLELDSGTLSPLLRRMEQAGFLKRTRGVQDERVVIVSLTERGRALENDLAHVPSCIADGSGLSLGQAHELLGTLHRLTTAMQATAGGSRPAETTSGQPPAAADYER